ncbi:hypothetical protein WJX72_008793 [[Myrmecia] bisecta]|uniref:Uncharacterized protein n=1 Tax=[Myrmecia] bisecta TaxID=41462 RepID=A0AAW1QS02_9CHLO
MPNSTTARLPGNNVPAVREEVHGMEVVISKSKAPAALLLLFHGCSRSPLDWFVSQPGCKACLGYPEELVVTRLAAARGFTSVAFSSSNTAHRCWDAHRPPESSHDIKQVVRVLQTLQTREHWECLPIYALGASSGGHMVLMLAFRIAFKGIACQIMAIDPRVFEQQPRAWGDPRNSFTYPPCMFIHMPRDVHTAAGVKADIRAMQKKGIHVGELLAGPLPLTPDLITSRFHDLEQGAAAAIVHALRHATLLDAAGYFISDPRQTAPQWQALVRTKVPATESLHMDLLAELFNFAYASHELTSQFMAATLDWWQRGT